jgi:type II secretory pathway pseudopilin PulG
MTTQLPKGRRGITLTEILISILIMGIGLISLATLFPIGLMRLREAQRASRSTLLAETAAGDVATQNLLLPQQFYFSGLYSGSSVAPPEYLFYDPFVQDYPLPTVSGAMAPFALTPNAVYRGTGMDNSARSHPNYIPQGNIAGPGLPVAFDPLWWASQNVTATVIPKTYGAPGPSSDPGTGLQNFRFASGIGFLRNDPNPTNSPNPSAYGLQRLTSLPFFDATGSTASPNAQFLTSLSRAGASFSSHDDPVLQTDANSNEQGGANDAGNAFGTGIGSPILPYLDKTGSLVYDWTYTWMFTGQRSDVSDTTVYDGNIVVFHNRPFGIDQIPASNGSGTVAQPSGERVVEAVFSYGPPTIAPGNTVGYSPNERIVLLRWPNTEPDPEIRVGGWIADVTYELNYAEDQVRFAAVALFTGTSYQGQRCYWYRVARKTAPEAETASTQPPAAANYRRMTLTLESPVRAQTLLDPTGAPVHVNAALVSPYVVNVFPKVFYTK